MKTSFELQEQLTSLTEGLLFPSESDYPIEPFVWENMSDFSLDTILQRAEKPLDSPVETTDLAYFFRNVAEEKDWHDDGQKLLVPKYREIFNTLTASLKNITVYRIGQTEIDVFIVGQSGKSDAVGLKTKVIET
ncbi:MAG: hypothetical protein HY22_11075 [[Candidatus Thermochlorobacteriaceae] bacterium GBChlB]|nr:MAG: hypothetical protein HY22_11075 [[Candidatus Thermochlorobacteriaceae] bacterium GBChlB]